MGTFPVSVETEISKSPVGFPAPTPQDDMLRSVGSPSPLKGSWLFPEHRGSISISLGLAIV